ncbi:MAG: glycosyltransferase family 9 protein [Bacteriovoracia bacterium]
MTKFHILCIRFSSLGDIILHSSVMSAIKKRWGDKVHISLLTSEAFAPLMEDHPDIDSVYKFSRKKSLAQLFKLFRSINQQRSIDLILDLHGTLRSLALRFRFMNIPRLSVDKRTLERSLLTTFKIDLLSGQNKYFDEREKSFGELLLLRNIRDFAEVFDLEMEREENRLSSNAWTFKDDPTLWKRLGLDFLNEAKYMVICPSASFPEKRWDSNKFKEVIEKLCQDENWQEYYFVILAGAQDDFCKVFNELGSKYQTEKGSRVINLQGKTNLVESALLSKHAKLAFGNDTGLPHIAESMGTPALFILGPTGQQFGFYPHLRLSKTIFADKLWCRPCTTNGKGRCIRFERYCLTGISVERVYEELNELKDHL